MTVASGMPPLQYKLNEMGKEAGSLRAWQAGMMLIFGKMARDRDRDRPAAGVSRKKLKIGLKISGSVRQVDG